MIVSYDIGNLITFRSMLQGEIQTIFFSNAYSSHDIIGSMAMDPDTLFTTDNIDQGLQFEVGLRSLRGICFSLF